MLAIAAVITQQYLNLACKAGLGKIVYPKNGTKSTSHSIHARLITRTTCYVENLILWMVYVFTFQDFSFAKAIYNPGRDNVPPYKKVYTPSKKQKTCLSKKEKEYFDAMMKHFRNICQKIPISSSSNPVWFDLDKKKEDLQKKAASSVSEYIKRINTSSALSTRYLGEKIIAKFAPDPNTIDKWCHGTLLPHCILTNRFLSFYKPTSRREGHKQHGKKIWVFHDVPKNFDYITESEHTLLSKEHKSLLQPVQITKTDKPYKPYMRRKSSKEEAPGSNTTIRLNFETQPDENDTDYEDNSIIPV
jgi:hypothetical protein